jgi:trigger factor
MTQIVKLPKLDEFGQYANKKVKLILELIKVLEISKSELDEDGLKWLGLDNIDALKERIEWQLRKDHQKKVRLCQKRDILDILSDLYSFDVPQSIVNKDFKEVWKVVHKELEEARRTDDEDVRGKTDEEIIQEYRDISIRRVRLGYIIEKIIETEKLEITADLLNEAVEKEIMRYPLNQKEIFAFYEKNPQALSKFYPEILENLAIKKIMEKASVEEKSITRAEFDELLSAFM